MSKAKQLQQELERLQVLENTFKVGYYRRVDEEEKKVKRAKARRHFGNFVKYTKPNYRWAWHNKLLANKLNDFAHGKIKRLMIFMPPRHGKSELGSRLLPAYIHGIKPEANVIAASYSSSLAKRMSRDVQRIMDSPPYQEVFSRVRLVPHKKKKGEEVAAGNYTRTAELFEIVGHGGSYRAAGVDTGITGMGADYCFVAETKVMTDRGQVPIIDIKIDDMVWSYNHDTKQPELRRVKALSRRDVSRVVQVETANGSRIVCTPDHPFWDDRGWYEEAEKLNTDSKLISADVLESQNANSNSILRSMYKRIQKIKGRLSEIVSKKTSEFVLFDSMFKRSSQHRTSKSVRKLRSEDSKQEQKVVRSLPNEATQQQRTEFTVQPSIQSNLPSNRLKRWFQVLTMSIRQAQSNTSHRRNQNEQPARESNCPVQKLSHSTPSLTGDALKSVTDLSEGAYTVFDIEVEGNHNFFAEGVLVHNCIIDDPLKDMKSANSKTIKDGIEEWYNSTLYTRLTSKGAVLIIQTRWSEDDLAGRLLANHLQEAGADEEEWEVLSLPAISTGFPSIDDVREEPGQPLWPEEYPLNRLLAIKGKVGGKVWASLFQQEPAPAEGNVVNTNWFQYYREAPEFDYIFASWDFTFKDKETSDFVVGQVWGVKGVRRYLVHQYRDRMSFTKTLSAIIKSVRDYPALREIVVEEKANGSAIIDTLKEKIGIIVPYNPSESKPARAAAIAPQIEAGNVYLPDPDYHPEANWVDDYINEWKHFPNGANDDQVDASTQALIRVSNSFGGWLSATTSGDNEVIEEAALSEELAGIFGFKIHGGGMGLGF